MSDPLKALYEALYTQLDGAHNLWDDRVRPEYIPGGDERPAIVYSHVGGGDNHRLRQRDPIFVVDVKCVASGENARVNSMTAAGVITDLLNNQGSQDLDANGDSGNGEVTGNDEWAILTITQGMRLHIVDNWSTNGVAIYHSGHEYTITMEAI